MTIYHTIVRGDLFVSARKDEIDNLDGETEEAHTDPDNWDSFKVPDGVNVSELADRPDGQQLHYYVVDHGDDDVTVMVSSSREVIEDLRHDDLLQYRDPDLYDDTNVTPITYNAGTELRLRAKTV